MAPNLWTLTQVSSDKVLTLDLETLNDNLSRLSAFVNTDDFNLKSVKSNQVRSKDVSTYTQLNDKSLDVEISSFLDTLRQKSAGTL